MYDIGEDKLELEYKKSKNELKKKEMLTQAQINNLLDFLKNLDYTKEELISTYNDLHNPYLKAHDLDQLISKIANDLHIKFNKTISQGQAEAVIKRVLDIKLSSTGRTQLSEFRKKIRKYEKLVSYFKDWSQIYDHKFKVVIVGLTPEQASAYLPPPAIPEFYDQRSALGLQFYLKTVEISVRKVQLQLWDISNDSEYRSLIQQATDNSYIYWVSADANGAIIVFEKNNRESFNLAKETYNELRSATNLKFELKEEKNIYIDIPIILVGVDNGRKVTAEEAQTFAKKINAYSYVEVSETDNQNFEQIFSSLSLGIITNIQNALRKPTEESYSFKVAVVGDIRVGKTSLIELFTKGSFKKAYIKTLGAKFSISDKKIGGNLVRFTFWDIAGGKSFQYLQKNFFKGSRAAIIVYSLEENNQERDNFSQISDWHGRIKNFCGDIPIALIANKADLVDEKAWKNPKIQKFVEDNEIIGHYLTSARTRKGALEAIHAILNGIYRSFVQKKEKMI